MPVDLGDIIIRTEEESDLPLVRKVFVESRPDLQLLPLPAAQKNMMVEQQFQAQRHSYRLQFPGALYQIVEKDGIPIGRLYTESRENDVRLIDIALLPQARNTGIGSILLRHTIEEARAGGKAVSLSVEMNNPAQRLYERLGFRVVSDAPPYLEMTID